MELRDLFTNLRAADVRKREYTQERDGFEATSAIVVIESMDNPDLIKCEIEIPWSELEKYGLTESVA